MIDDSQVPPEDDQTIRHTHQEREFEPAFGDEATIEAVEQHIETWIGPADNVYHELLSDLVHVDLHIVSPTEDRNWYTIVTSGMSDLPMTVPEGAEEFRYAELMLCLPEDWPLEHEAFDNEDHYWPLRWLKILARFPHEYATWLGFGHTIPNGDPPEPFADNTELCCQLILSPLTIPEEGHSFQVEDKTVHLYSLVPIYAEEMNYKLRHGVEALLDKFDDYDVSEILDPTRPNTCLL